MTARIFKIIDPAIRNFSSNIREVIFRDCKFIFIWQLKIVFYFNIYENIVS